MVMRYSVKITLAALVFLFVASAAHAKPPKVLVLPLVVDEDIVDRWDDKADAVNRQFAKEMKKNEYFIVEDSGDFKKKFKQKQLRRVLACGTDIDCLISRRLLAKGYSLFVTGKVRERGNKWEAKFVVFNIDAGERKRQKKFRFEPASKPPKQMLNEWAVKLLQEPQKLVTVKEEIPVAAVEEEREEERRPSRPRRDVATPDEVLAKTKAAFSLWVAGDMESSLSKIRDARAKRCDCRADMKAGDLELQLNRFSSAYSVVQTKVKNQDGKGLINSLQDLKILEEDLVREGERLGIKDESKYKKELPALFAQAHVLVGKDLVRQQQYLEAREQFNKALEIDANHKEAKEELAKFSRYSTRLFSQANYNSNIDPDLAVKQYKQLIELVGEDSPMADKANERLQELLELME